MEKDEFCQRENSITPQTHLITSAPVVKKKKKVSCEFSWEKPALSVLLCVSRLFQLVMWEISYVLLNRSLLNVTA